MTDEKEIQARRLAEKKAYRLTLTGDAAELIKTLKERSPEAWRSYVRTVEQQAKIKPKVFDVIYHTVLALFPGRDTEQVVDLIARMLEMVQQELRDEEGASE
ncbi:hypothetical protein [Bradyrhizobium sp. CCBAU 51753]|uniref:hypothetical protein n=1 Tax=Bradyrhizobium sp. CCBAU 51753 TaxID=1325100 RepID=UPI00188C482A|nr:hypothetical protein [Bradyrhizobium sp. CCBAU 51753]